MIQDASLLFPWGEVVTWHYVALHQGVWEQILPGLSTSRKLHYTKKSSVCEGQLSFWGAQWVRALHSTCKVSICMNSHEEQNCFQTPACHACSTHAWHQRDRSFGESSQTSLWFLAPKLESYFRRNNPLKYFNLHVTD